MIKNGRPVYLNLIQFRFPVAAVMSVGHRASGLFMVLVIPFLVYLLDLTTRGPEGFASATAIVQNGLVQLLLFVLLWGLMHHLLAGIRFLLIDFDIGVDKESARFTAFAVMILAPILAIIVGYLI